MVTTQDCSIGLKAESTYKTGVTVDRWLQFLDEGLDWVKQTKQGKGLRVGRRVDLSARRTNPLADGGGDITVELHSKGLGTLLQACFGTGVSTLVSGTTYQQGFTLGDTPSSLTVQKGVVEAGGTVDAYTFLGCMVEQFELNFPNGDIATLKATLDAGDLATATAYATPSYPTEPVQLFEFKGGTISTGTLTVPTTTALASSVTSLASVRDLNLQVNNNLQTGRFNFGGSGRKDKPLVGTREITGTMNVEYSSTTLRDAHIADTPMTLLLTMATTTALSTGFETFQLALPEIKLDGDLPKANGSDLIVVPIKFTVLDNLTAAQPIYGVMRTADSAL